MTDKSWAGSLAITRLRVEQTGIVCNHYTARTREGYPLIDYLISWSQMCWCPINLSLLVGRGCSEFSSGKWKWRHTVDDENVELLKLIVCYRSGNRVLHKCTPSEPTVRTIVPISLYIYQTII